MPYKNTKILIIDDVQENIDILSAILQKEFFIQNSTDGYEALKKIQKEQFDLILLDINMPNISGFEVCRFLKIDPKTKNIPIIFLTANDDKKTLAKAFEVGAIDYIRKPFFKEELLARVYSALRTRNYEKNLEEEVQRHIKELEEAQIHLMLMLGGVAEGHSIETYHHVKRVGNITYILAKSYGLDEKAATTLKYASYLHDIGKIGIKDYILHKEGKLTKEEFKEIKKHPKIGASMLDGVKLPLFEVAQIVSEQHHEKWDGSGYPNSYKKEKIHIYARIVAIADVFDALVSSRSYKKRWDIDSVKKFFQEKSGSHFDPQLIEHLFTNIDQCLALYGSNIKQHTFTESKTKKRKWFHIFSSSKTR